MPQAAETDRKLHDTENIPVARGQVIPLPTGSAVLSPLPLPHGSLWTKQPDNSYTTVLRFEDDARYELCIRTNQITSVIESFKVERTNPELAVPGLGVPSFEISWRLDSHQDFTDVKKLLRLDAVPTDFLTLMELVPYVYQHARISAFALDTLEQVTSLMSQKGFMRCITAFNERTNLPLAVAEYIVAEIKSGRQPWAQINLHLPIGIPGRFSEPALTHLVENLLYDFNADTLKLVMYGNPTTRQPSLRAQISKISVEKTEQVLLKLLAAEKKEASAVWDYGSTPYNFERLARCLSSFADPALAYRFCILEAVKVGCWGEIRSVVQKFYPDHFAEWDKTLVGVIPADPYFIQLFKARKIQKNDGRFFKEINYQKLAQEYALGSLSLHTHSIQFPNNCLPRALADSFLDSYLQESKSYRQHHAILFVAKNVNAFESVDKEKLVRGLLESNNHKELFDVVRSLRGLSADLAKAIIHTTPAVFVENFGSFKLSHAELSELSELLIQKHGLHTAIALAASMPPQLAQVLEPEYYLASYQRDLGIDSVEIYNIYKGFSDAGDLASREVFARDVTDWLTDIISPQAISPEALEHPLYPALCRAAYPPLKSSNQQNEARDIGYTACADNTHKLAQFIIRSHYSMNIAEGIEMVLKPGVQQDEHGILLLQERVKATERNFAQIGYDPEKMRKLIYTSLALDLESNLEMGILEQFLDAQVQQRGSVKAKELLIAYRLAFFEDIASYFQATVARCERSKSPEYAHQLELNEFYADKLYDAAKAVVAAGIPAGQLSDSLKRKASDLYLMHERERLQQKANRFELSKLGLSAGLKRQLEQLEKIPEEDKREKLKNAVLKRERAHCAHYVSQLLGISVEPETIDLASFDPKQILQRAKAKVQIPSDETLASFVMNQYLVVFADDCRLLKQELSKFQPADQNDRKAMKLHGVITMNHASVRARVLGGVCVAGDNPTLHAPDRECQWNQNNFFQMVLRDPVSKACVGVVMLHHYYDQGRKILTASINPSSTYVYKVDERGLFNAILSALVDFAQDNEFDFVTCSTSKGIRTNRTGGEFERALNDAIQLQNNRITLSQNEVFSFFPKYLQKDLDVLWSRTA